MNPATLERLIKDCYESAQTHSTKLEKLDDFCEKNWGIRLGDFRESTGTDDRIVGSVDYGEYIITVDEFREIMDKEKAQQKQDSVK